VDSPSSHHLIHLGKVPLYSSPLEFILLSNLIFPVGSVIALLSILEETLRLRPFVCLSASSTTRHSVLVGLAIFAGVTSLIGVVLHAVDDSRGLQPLLLGRAVGKAFHFVTNQNCFDGSANSSLSTCPKI